MLAGTAIRTINGELGRPIQGATVKQVAESVRDDLEANALYLVDGDQQALLVSCDLVAVPTATADRARAAMAASSGLPEAAIVVTATHTHAGPSVAPTCYGKPVDEEYLAKLEGILAELAAEAVADPQPVQLGWGKGAARIGYNRRCCWADGSHSMHGAASKPGFTGLEGPDDDTQTGLFVRDMAGKLLAILHSNTSHPTCFYGANFYSADFPGAARGFLRDIFGPIPVLYFNGAFGDIALDPQPVSGFGEQREQKMLRAAHLLCGETLRLLHEAEFSADLPLRHVQERLPIPVRLPTAERLAVARQTLDRVDAGEDIPIWDQLFAFGSLALQEEFGEPGQDILPIHALRVGDFALVTQPCELFCHFGLNIKRRSPAAATAVCGPANGYCGYCPTLEGIIGGGYSGEPILWTRLDPEAGYRIVDTASRLLRDIF
jgi:hypothetical protein